MKIGLHLGTDHQAGRAQGVYNAIETAASIGAKAVQLALCDMTSFFSDLGENDRTKLDEAGKLAIEKGVTVLVHHCYVCNPAYDGPQSKWKLALKSLDNMMRMADAVHAPYFVAHCGSHKDMGRHHGLDKLVETTRYVLDKGFKTCLLWENGAGGGTQCGHLEDVLEVVSKLEGMGPSVKEGRVGMCLDTAHLYADGRDMRVEGAHIARLVKPYVKAVHWNSPDQNVVLGKHADRHTVAWEHGIFKYRDMRDIASLFPDLPLIMEASGAGAYQANILEMKRGDLWVPEAADASLLTKTGSISEV